MSTESTIAQNAERLHAVFEEAREGLQVAYGLATGSLEFTTGRAAMSEAAETKLARELRAAHDYALKYMVDEYAWIDVARLAIRMVGASDVVPRPARAIVGFVVVDIKTRKMDWDGELHPTREAAVRSLTDGHTWWVRTPGEAADGRTFYGDEYEILELTR